MITIPMNRLIRFNHQPYDRTDIAWNGLRLSETLPSTGMRGRIVLMNDSVDLARDAAKGPTD